MYQATITTTESTETYVGLTATEFKTRWRNHQMSFKHESKKNDTELSKHLWQLKDQKKDFTISWKILAKAKSYTNLTKRCNLCNTEKFYIILINRTPQRLTSVMSLYQLAGTSESFSLNSIASSRTNHKITNVYYYCSLSLNFVTVILLMYINPSDLTDEWTNSSLVYETDLY